MQRLFGRAIIRADIPARYSQGFNPHMNLSFASPLAVGLESMGDYLEFYTDEDISLASAIERLNRNMPDGFRVLNMGAIGEKVGKLMALTALAEYEVECEENFFSEWLSTVMSSSVFMLTRERKGKTRDFDIRPLIRRCDSNKGNIRLLLENSGSASLSPLYLLKEAAKSAEKVPLARVLRKELYTIKDGAVLPLDALFEQGQF
jgi:radical SAM-linked protein